MQDPSARIVRIAPGFAAPRRGRFQLGDILTAVAPADQTGPRATASQTPDEIRRLTIGPAGAAVTLHLVRGPEAPLMLRGLHYTVKLRRLRPNKPAGSPADRAAARSLVCAKGAAPPPTYTAASTAAAAAAELLHQVQRFVVGGGADGAEPELEDGVRGGFVFFYI